MFKKSNKEPQLDAFTNVPMMLESSAFKQYSDKGHWHNQFHDQVVMRIDETQFSVLFNNTTGAPNSSIRTLVGMMILKESSQQDRKSTRLNSSHIPLSRMPSSA